MQFADLAIGREALQRQILSFEGDEHLLDVPVDTPALHVLERPRLVTLTRLKVEAHQAVERHAQQLLYSERVARLLQCTVFSP